MNLGHRTREGTPVKPPDYPAAVARACATSFYSCQGTGELNKGFSEACREASRASGLLKTCLRSQAPDVISGL